MCSERAIADDIRNGIEEVLATARRSWYQDHFTRSGFSQQQLAQMISYDRSRLSKVDTGKSHMDHALLVLLTQAFVKVKKHKPDFAFCVPPVPSAADCVLGGYLYALNRAADRAKIKGTASGPLYFFCLQELTTNRDGRIAIARGSQEGLEAVARPVIGCAGQKASCVQHTLAPQCTVHRGCVPDQPVAANAGDLKNLLRIWKKPWQEIVPMMKLSVEDLP
jgi:hypothetical protein